MSQLIASELATTQYKLVQQARAVLLDYCATLAPAHFVAPVPAFAHGSIRDLLTHVADTYRHWLGGVALGQPVAPTPAAEVPNVAALRQLFGTVDALVGEFGRRYGAEWLAACEFGAGRPPAPLVLSPWQLFTHVVTHEFHHKGQVLTMSRLLGYVPVDTDVIRT